MKKPRFWIEIGQWLLIFTVVAAAGALIQTRVDVAAILERIENIERSVTRIELELNARPARGPAVVRVR